MPHRYENSHGITQCYLRSGRGDIPAFTVAGTRFATQGDPRLSLHTRWYTSPKTVTHPNTNRSQRRVTLFVRQTTTPLRQTAGTHRLQFCVNPESRFFRQRRQCTIFHSRSPEGDTETAAITAILKFQLREKIGHTVFDRVSATSVCNQANQVNLALHPSGVAKSSTSFNWLG